MREKRVISGIGCALADYLYTGISFQDSSVKKYLSKRSGDGGIEPGKLVFCNELEYFTGRSYEEVINEVTNFKNNEIFNVGGPSIVSLIHASQLLYKDDFEVRFFGILGMDDTGSKILNIVNKTPLNTDFFLSISELPTPFTTVLSDPNYNGGQGERTFINNVGSAWDYFPEMIDNQFFESDIVCFGGTAIVPHIHDNLNYLLRNAKDNGCITLVNTVYDFRSENKNPGEPWPLISKNDYYLIDVLVMDFEEALKLSGKETIREANEFFDSTPLHTCIITNGANDLLFWSKGGIFKELQLTQLPVSKLVTELLKKGQQKGDTTGCGDNFVGGIIASMAWQLCENEVGELDLVEAVIWGIASGGYCCFEYGGTHLESMPGEKFSKVQQIRLAYIQQVKQEGLYFHKS